jgi:hypothetical protein
MKIWGSKVYRLLALVSCITIITFNLSGCKTKNTVSEKTTSEDTVSENAVSGNTVSENNVPDSTDDTQPSETTELNDYIGKHPLSNKNADKITQRVYDYICDNFGKKLCQPNRSQPGWEPPIMKWTIFGKKPVNCLR